MSYRAKLMQEVNKKLDALPKSDWWERLIALDVCKDHESVLPASGDSSERALDHLSFWKHGGYEVARDAVRDCINNRAGDDAGDDEKEPSLPGWNFLRTHYTVRRKEPDTAVPQVVGVAIENLADFEIKQIVKRMRRSAKRLNGHADELERYGDLRGGDVKATMGARA
jgi:hypothetical protein